MLVDNAEAMQDYDFAKNKDIDVSMLTQGSNVVVWWKCSACGTEWQTSVYHYIQRIKPCPVCSTIDKGRTSFQEQAVAYYAKKYFPKVVIGDKKAIGKELDIYIPSIRAAIEYDGVRYHSDEKRVKNDEEKSEKCKRNGIRLIRIREYGLPEIRNSENIIRENNRGHATLDAAIRQCLEMLGVSEPNIDTQKDSKDIYRQYKDYKAERSMGGRHPELLKEWDYELNVGIDPLMVSSSSSEVVHWICLWKRRCLSRKVEQRIVHANGEQESVKDVRECLNISKQTIVDLKKGIVVYVNDGRGKRSFAGFCVLQSERCGHFRHLQSGKVVYVRPTTVHYKKLNPNKAISQTAKPVIYRNTEDFLREKSYLENDVLMMLKCNGIEYQREKMFPWMGKKRLDFFLPGKNIAIECQGVQHFYPYGSDDRDFEARKQRDTDKYNECASNGVQVLYYMSELIPVPDEMARKYQYVTSLDELLGILNDK